MLTLSPRIFSTLAWEADDSMSTRDHEFTCEDPFANFIAHDQPELNHFDDHLQQSITTTASSSSHKKLNHNAYERDRRKKLNTLYTSLHALLPEIDRSKKLSIPSTISRVLKYIPELQREVVRLKRRKEEIAMMATRREEVQVIRDGIEDSPVVSATLLSNKEVMVHICIMNKNVTSVPLSKILRVLEGEGLELIHASTSTTFGYGRFYSLHLKQIKQCTNMACEHLVKVIREKARCDSFIQ
ncbi:protein IRON-RELATED TRANSCRIPTION FACTOR 2-like isoform X3 [Typha angustifolia]|uniref:protein IRON-RELATED TRANSCRIPTION FACTOR 2-like isoform X3 n=1 Tax=Typha angustifolia TaxID=59011 RepID=UPI003C2ED78D